LQQGLLTLLQDLYGSVPDVLAQQLERITDRETLRTLYAEAVRAGSLEAFQQRLNAIVADRTSDNGTSPSNAG